ncbi:histidine-rich glycoprotein-like [Gracilinanus agilis]|uniref:histidine-rich glycoprotein-like n=1 Tax=Gracilinanus agilis TaxID=191870 RepID=UPI001CFDB638|nr:histidine-rich glycoprotein-like [Gracilinanus agilis]XP_044541093.1 histidine-rich glycoprotein-like [Gracilinanus agilis]
MKGRRSPKEAKFKDRELVGMGGMPPPYIQICPPHPSAGPAVPPNPPAGCPGSGPYPPNVNAGGAPGHGGHPPHSRPPHGHPPPRAPGMTPGGPYCVPAPPGCQPPPGHHPGHRRHHKHGPGHPCRQGRRGSCSSGSDSA